MNVVDVLWDIGVSIVLLFVEAMVNRIFDVDNCCRFSSRLMTFSVCALLMIVFSLNLSFFCCKIAVVLIVLLLVFFFFVLFLQFLFLFLFLILQQHIVLLHQIDRFLERDARNMDVVDASCYSQSNCCFTDSTVKIFNKL